MRTASQRFLRRAAAVLLGLVAVFVLLELVLRIADWQPAALLSKRSLLDRTPTRRVWYDCYPSNPHAEFKPVPDVSNGQWVLLNNLLPPEELPLARLAETPWCVQYELSSRGLRDAERSVEPASGVARVALVGDSFAFGEGVPVEKALAASVQSALGAQGEVLNFGWPGDDTRKEIARLEAAIEPFHLRRAVVVFIANDIEMAPELQHEQEYINDLVQVRDAYLSRHRAGTAQFSWSRLLTTVSGYLDMRRVTAKTIQWYRDLYDPAKNGVALQRFRAALEHLAKEPNCRVVLVLYPLLEHFEGAYPLQPVHDAVAAMARTAGLPVLDLAPAFAGQRTEDLWVHPCDHHPNGRAHAIAGRALADWLQRGVPGFLTP